MTDQPHDQERVTVTHEAGDPAVPNAPAQEQVDTPRATVPEDRRAPVEDINPPAGSSTTTANPPATGTGSINTAAGDQFGEQPSPIPAQFAERVATSDSGVRALPRSDSQVVQPAPVVVGSHQVVLEVATPPTAPQAITAPANRVGVIGPFGLTQLARQVYGDAARAADIFDANKDTMVSPDSTYIGQVVRLPD